MTRAIKGSLPIASAPLLLLMLTACDGGDSGGGDGGIGSNAPAEEDPLIDQAASNAIQSQLPDGDDVKIAVLDRPLDTEHIDLDGLDITGFNATELTNRLVFGYSTEEVDGLVEWQDGDGSHGQAVTSIMAGDEVGYGKNLDLVHGNFEEPVLVVDATIGAGEAARRGAQAINISFTYDPVSRYKAVSADTTTNENEIEAFNKVTSNEAVIVVPSGNGSDSFTAVKDADNTWDASNKLYEHTLAVGATDGDGNLASFSNVAGTNEAVQGRYLVAPGAQVVASEPGTGDRFERISGTSFAAPVVTAAIGELISIWPNSINAVQAANHLLKTADRSFTNAYSKEDCGPNDNTNCGLYRFGQGRLDWEAVLEPSGTLGMATLEEQSVDTVNDDKQPVTKTTLTLSPAMRSTAETLRGAVSEVHAFDDLGRNYIVDLSGSINSAANHRMSLQGRLSTYLDTAMALDERTETRRFGAYQQSIHYDGDGRVRSMDIGMPMNGDGSLTAGMFTFAQGGSIPSDRAPTKGKLMTYQGHTPLNQQLRDGYGVTTGYSMTPNIELTTRYWTARNRVKQGGGSDRVHNFTSAMRYTRSNLAIEGGLSRIHETDGLLGMTGSAGLTTDNGSELALGHIEGEYSRGGWTGFAVYQRGRAEASFDDSLLADVDATVEQIAFGSEYSVSDSTSIAAAASTGLNVRTGEAQLRLASGVQPGGDIAFRNETVRLDGGDRPIRLELGVNHQLSDDTAVGINLINAPTEAGGDDRASALAARYSTRF